MRLGFVIDHSKCIGCHACTVACKAENDVPLGSFRTWVKYTERGTFPEVRRSFAVLRCNQCSAAPCVTICPVNALHKRDDGIVDIDPALCVGCKACMQACPYDALYINDERGVAEKCHFCAHRVEVGLAPACAVVCPTEAIVPGDFDDPDSAVSLLARSHALTARKEEAGTRPNVLYRDAEPAGLEPLAPTSSGAWMWADRIPGAPIDPGTLDATLQTADRRARPRATYNVDHAPLWGSAVTAYLLAKAVAAGAFLILALMLPALLTDPLARGGRSAVVLPVIGLAFLGLTSALLVFDLKRPERFLFLLFRPNTSSWLVRGAWVLTGYGAFLLLWLWLLGSGISPWPWSWALVGVGIMLAALTACYTAWLFGQAHGRVLWMRRGLATRFLLQALAAGGALAILLAPWLMLPRPALDVARWSMAAALLMLLMSWRLVERRGAPRGREVEFAAAVEVVTRGPFAARHLWLGEVVGCWIAALLAIVPNAPWLWAAAAVMAVIGLWADDDVLVRAGQALPIS